MDSFLDCFVRTTEQGAPFTWQRDLASHEDCANRLIRIPTGFGKTLGVLSTWLWHRVVRGAEQWPRRLVWCLPMRVLVEQTEQEARAALARIGRLWDSNTEHADRVGVHSLMGGVDGGDWHLYPEGYAVLIGTQDMLLSRALNRGYGSPRARWPMEFGLLNHDCLWVMDEVQLMDVGLATSGQLQAFRDQDRNRSLRPCYTWWMSATLQRDWLAKSPETAAASKTLPQTAVPPSGRSGALWEEVRKPCQQVDVSDPGDLARRVAAEHRVAGRGASGPTLVVVNTVDRAVEVFDALARIGELDGTDLRLVHSRFRPLDRAPWRDDFLNRSACAPGTDRIVVATQVVEAGVDFSAGLLVTELAPWPSLVQRFGRCARWGGRGEVLVADFRHREEQVRPYSEAELDAARTALAHLPDVAPLHLERFEEQYPELLPSLYPYEPTQLLLRHELEELFDTTPDLTGADLDISRFIRSGDERDLQVFWADIPERETPSPELKPTRDVLCAVPFLKAREWLGGKRKATTLLPHYRHEVWVWDWLDGTWRNASARDLYPGQTVLLSTRCGGYDYDPETHAGKGWWPAAAIDPGLALQRAAAVDVPADEQADSAQDDESLSEFPWQTIATHGREVGALAQSLVPAGLAGLLDLAGRWHDAGKGHPAFNGSIVALDRPARNDLAKAPARAWLKGKNLYPMPDGSRRPGFRHELASTLALFGVLQRYAPDHSALLGPWHEWLSELGLDRPRPPDGEPEPTPVEREILALEAEEFDLLAYLVCAHHGKLRLAWHACPADQRPPAPNLRVPQGQAADHNAPRIRGIVDGESLPALVLADSEGRLHVLPETRLDLAPAAAGLNPRTGAGWTERVLGLLARHGPFTLAWLEALLRAADQRASRRAGVDPLLASPSGSPGPESRR